MSAQSSTVPDLSIAEHFVSQATAASPAVMKLAGSSDSWWGVQELEAIVQADPEFSLRVLSLANSAFYSQRHKIESLRQALVVVGDKMVQRLAAGALAQNLSSSAAQSGDFLRHSFAVAVCAAKLAQVHRKMKSEVAFATALLHDIGLVALARYASDGDSEVQSTDVSAQISELLGLPENMVAALAAQRQAPNLENACVLAQTVGLAKALAIAAGFGEDREELNLNAWEKTLQALCIQATDLVLLEQHLSDTVESEIERLGF